MHHCFNVVAHEKGAAAAVLVRSVAPLSGFREQVRTDGPGRLCRAMSIDLRLNRAPLSGPDIAVEPGVRVPDASVERGPRVGVAYAGEWALAPYRLWVRGALGRARSLTRGPEV